MKIAVAMATTILVVVGSVTGRNVISVTSPTFSRLSFTAPRNCVTKSGRKRLLLSRRSWVSAMALASVLGGGGEDHACSTLQQAAARRAAPSARAAGQRS